MQAAGKSSDVTHIDSGTPAVVTPAQLRTGDNAGRKEKADVLPTIKHSQVPALIPRAPAVPSSQALVCSQASWMLEGRDTFLQRHLSKYGHAAWKSLFRVITLYVQMKKMPTAFLIQTSQSQAQYSFFVPGTGGVGGLWGRGPQSTQ